MRSRCAGLCALKHSGRGVMRVDGTPTDCVNIAIKVILEGRAPDMVVSGINKGYNLGDDVTYSGTVAGALEAALLGIPALAVSLGRGGRPAPTSVRRGASGRRRRRSDDRAAAPAANVPERQRAAGSCRAASRDGAGTRNHQTSITSRVDPRGRSYYWIDEAQCDWHDDDDPTTWPCGRLRVGDAASAGHDRARRPRSDERARARRRRAGALTFDAEQSVE